MVNLYTIMILDIAIVNVGGGCDCEKPSIASNRLEQFELAFMNFCRFIT